MYAKQIVHSDRLCHRKIQAVSDRTSVHMDLALDDQVQKVQQQLLAGKRDI
ncbi:hypothetical protein T03_13305 [Trichinella britovi]|uniref:Uncharacterized protein n=1 Tax=Trichinella britovi TaxID=45882 RepID=A0A0V1AM10_TRIBR|nr:hypothetical protein T03_13305 [Trichinella britovi]